MKKNYILIVFAFILFTIGKPSYAQTIDEILGSNVTGLIEYQGKIMVSAANGTFIYDPIENSLELSDANVKIRKNMADVHNGILYVIHEAKLYSFNGSIWAIASSSLPLAGVRAIKSALGKLLICYYYSGARVYEWNSGNSWSMLGSTIGGQRGALGLGGDATTLYVGTHWDGGVYQWLNGTWNLVAGGYPFRGLSIGAETIYDLEVCNGVLYVTGTNRGTRGIYKLGLNNKFTLIQAGTISDIETHIVNGNEILVYTLWNNSSGVMQYDGTTKSNLYPVIDGSYYSDLCSFNGDLYYGSHSVYGAKVPALYKNGEAIVLGQNSDPLAITLVSQTDVSCSTGYNGGFTFELTGGKTPFTYKFNDQSIMVNNNSIYGLEAGTYILKVTDDLGEEVSIDVTITEPTLLEATGSESSAVTGFGKSDGSATVTPSGGVGPYTILPVQTGLLAGTQIFTVTDANGCMATVDVIITEPALLTAEGSESSAVTGFGLSDGSATVTPSGGVGPYTIEPDPSGLTAGTYTFIVTDANGNEATIDVEITEPEALTISGEVLSAVTGFGASDGSATVTPLGGVEPYSISPEQTDLPAGTHTFTVTDANGYTATVDVEFTEPEALTISGEVLSAVTGFGASDGSATVTPLGGVEPYSISPEQTDLPAGTHTFTVTDANGYTATVDVIITEPDLLIFGGSESSAVKCNGGSDGIAVVTPSGGVAPYTILPEQTGLEAGTHTFTVTDANGYEATVDVIITEPAALTATFTQTNVSCNGGADGSVTITPLGGTGDYMIAEPQTALIAGDYVFIVEDENGCTATVAVTITEPEVLTAVASANISTVYYGYKPTSIELEAIVNGGTVNYILEWSGIGLSDPNSYTPTANPTESSEEELIYQVKVTDGNGCIEFGDISVKFMDVRCGKKLDKVLVYHKKDQKGEKVLCVGKDGVADHLAHGDRLASQDEYESWKLENKKEKKDKKDKKGKKGKKGKKIKAEVYPNPFKGKCNIIVTVEEETRLLVEIYDSFGTLQKVIFEGNVKEGKYTYSWNSGRKNKKATYYLRVTSDSGVETKVLLKH